MNIQWLANITKKERVMHWIIESAIIDDKEKQRVRHNDYSEMNKNIVKQAAKT